MYISGIHSGSSGSGSYISGSSSVSRTTAIFYPRAFTTVTTYSESYYRMQDAITILILIIAFIMIFMYCCMICQVKKKPIYYTTSDYDEYNSDYYLVI